MREGFTMASDQMSRLRALVVEDCKDDAHTFALLLKYKGWRVAVCDDAAQAVALAQEFRPSVIFLDIWLEGASGFDIARSIREQDLPPYLLVARTALADYQNRQRCIDAGFDCLFIKPREQKELDELLDMARKVAAAEVALGNG